MTYKRLTIDAVLDEFLPPTQGLALARVLHGRLLDSLVKACSAVDKRTRERHGARVEAFLAGCRSCSDLKEMARGLEVAFPKELAERHFIAAARLLRMQLVDRASRLQLPTVTNRGVAAGAPVPTLEQLLRTVRATKLIKATAEKRIGHPLLVQTIRQHGWKKSDVERALARRYPDIAEVKRYVRSFAKNGAFESVL